MAHGDAPARNLEVLEVQARGEVRVRRHRVRLRGRNGGRVEDDTGPLFFLTFGYQDSTNRLSGNQQQNQKHMIELFFCHRV